MSPASSNTAPRTSGLDDAVRKSLDQYFSLLGDQKPHALHDMVTQATEKPLLDYVMRRYRGNISHASEALGLTRNTLRKKLKVHELSDKSFTEEDRPAP